MTDTINLNLKLIIRQKNIFSTISKNPEKLALLTSQTVIRIITTLITYYIDKTMEYFINQKFHFDGINETIKPIGRDTPLIKLSKPSSRLLEELLTQPGTTLSREELLQTVWENHGLTPSTSNLSNHISFLRKVFSQLGEHEKTIITVPKEGFKIEVSVTCKNSDHICDKKNDEVKTKIDRYRKTKKLYLSGFFIIAVLMMVIFILLHYCQPTSMNIEKCQIKEISHESSELRKNNIKALKRLVRKNSIDCESRDSAIFYELSNTRNLNTKTPTFTFISQCEITSNNTLSHCENYFSVLLKKP